MSIAGNLNIQEISDESLVVLLRKAQQHMRALGYCSECFAEFDTDHAGSCSVGKAFDEALRRLHRSACVHCHNEVSLGTCIELQRRNLSLVR